MREITVTYRLSDEEESRLRKITEAYRKYIPDITEDRVFKAIMATGSETHIKRKLDFTDFILS